MKNYYQNTLTIPIPWRIRLRNFFAVVAEAIQRSKTSGDVERLFEALLAEHSDLISGICFSFVGTGTTFDDLKQDALINIWRGLSSYHGDSKLSTWIYRVTLNSCISTMRRANGKINAVESLENIIDIADIPDEKIEQIEILHELISHLNPMDRSLILMWLDERSYEEISDVMGMNQNTVGTRLSRIRDKLKRMNTLME